MLPLRTRDRRLIATQPSKTMGSIVGATQREERRWSRPARFLFMVSAASACWGMVFLIAYLVWA